MNWQNLKNMKCVDCGKPIARNLMLKNYKCTNPKCGYTISQDRFNELVNDLYKPKVHDNFRDDNSHELNNFDRPEMTKGFL